MVGLGQEGLREGGENCVKYPKRWWNRREGRGKKILKKAGGGDKLGQGVGALNRGAGTPLQTLY